MRLIEILHQEVSTNHDQDKAGWSGEAVKEVLAGGSDLQDGISRQAAKPE